MIPGVPSKRILVPRLSLLGIGNDEPHVIDQETWPRFSLPHRLHLSDSTIGRLRSRKMGRIIKGHYRRHFRPTPHPVPLNRYALEKTEWKQAVCSVCLEAPHNAVLLLCSSHDKGCRPYMCGTSFRHSNCLDLFKKANAKPVITASPSSQEHSASLNWPSCKKTEAVELSCPLCRGELKGWTVVEPARRHLNRKKRSCMHDGCSFIGTYKKLKKHVKDEHREAKPRKVDPALEAKWRALEMQTEHQDVMSTIRSSMPGAVVLGDYVIDMHGHSSDIEEFDDDEEDDEFDDDSGGDRDFLHGRRGGSSSSSRGISQNFLLFLAALQQESSRLARIRRDTGIQAENGGNGGATVGYQSEEDDIHTGDGRSRVRPLNLVRDGRRRLRRRQGRSRGRSVSGLS